MERMMKHQELTSENHEALMKNLERQIGQLSKQAVIERPTSSLLSDTILNLKEECKAIQLRSGKTLVKDKETNKKRMGNDKRPAEKDEANNKEEDKQDQEKLKEKDEQPQASRKGKQVMEESSQEQRKEVKIYTPPLPYPQRLQKELNDQQFPKFLEELINKRRSWHEKETIMLTEECSAVIQKGLPPKLKDRRSFFLPCTIGNISIDKDLCDLGVSINLIPYSMMRRLCIEEVKSTQMSLELVDKSVVLPKGVIENLLVKVDKFIFPTDFVILDLGEEGSDSIILERPFLATARAIIDVEQGELTLRVHDESITLNVFPEAQHTDEKENCMNDDKEDLHWKEEYKEILISSPLKQKTSSKAGQKENETVQYDEKK
nr:uncharacterized protein LOC112709230 [Arachis hypogaea]